MLAPLPEETRISLLRTPPRRSLAPALLAVAAALGLAACGSEDTQEAGEAEGEFEVEVTAAEFPERQRLAERTDLVLGVENTGTETVPELAFTIVTDEGGADTSFDRRTDQTGLANPSRPVWVLENKYPRLVGAPPPKGLSGGLRAQTDTFGFGPLEPGEVKEAVWRLTPAKAGAYTLSYEVAAGLYGNAMAVTADGGPVTGEFDVKISDKPPRARVNRKGQVVTEN